MADIHEQAAEAAIKAHNAHREVSEERLRQLRQQPTLQPVRNYPYWFEAPGCGVLALLALIGIPVMALIALMVLASSGVIRPATASASSVSSSWTSVQKSVAEVERSVGQLPAVRQSGTVDISVVSPADQGIDWFNPIAPGVYPLRQQSTGLFITENGNTLLVNSSGQRLFR